MSSLLGDNGCRDTPSLLETEQADDYYSGSDRDSACRHDLVMATCFTGEPLFVGKDSEQKGCYGAGTEPFKNRLGQPVSTYNGRGYSQEQFRQPC
jgi:hypothetical protein